MDERLKTLHDKALSLPHQPGVYLMKDSSGKVIYVGKAKSLKPCHNLFRLSGQAYNQGQKNGLKCQGF